MYAIYNALTLLWAWLFKSVSIVGELVLVDARSAADGSQCKVRTVSMQQGNSAQAVKLKLIITINEPLWNVIAVSQHPLYVEIK